MLIAVGTCCKITGLDCKIQVLSLTVTLVDLSKEMSRRGMTSLTVNTKKSQQPRAPEPERANVALERAEL